MKKNEAKVKELEEYFRITEDPEKVFSGKSKTEKEISRAFQEEIARAVGGELEDGTIILDGYLSDIEIPDRAKPVMAIVEKYRTMLKEAKENK